MVHVGVDLHKRSADIQDRIPGDSVGRRPTVRPQHV